jgi:hypothetical protein
MNDPQIRAALERHWTTSAAGNQDAEHEIYNDDIVLEYPQSGERGHGRHKVQALRSHYPVRPSGFVVRRIVGEGDLRVSEYVITYDGRRVNTVSIMEFQAGKLVRETQYFAEPFEPPAWRACLSDNPTNQELDASSGVDSGMIEETARLDEWCTPIPLKHLASCQIEGSR